MSLLVENSYTGRVSRSNVKATTDLTTEYHVIIVMARCVVILSPDKMTDMTRSDMNDVS